MIILAEMVHKSSRTEDIKKQLPVDKHTLTETGGPAHVKKVV